MSESHDALRVTPGDLDTLVTRVWTPSVDADWAVTAAVGSLPETHRVVEQYAVAPSRRTPRYLLPIDSPRAVSASFTTHLSTPSRRSRELGRGIALAWRSGAGERLVRSRLTVGVDRSVPDSELGNWLLLRHLGNELGRAGLVAVWPIRRAMPNAKPTARLLDASGDAVGYLKVGWSDPTRALVVNEARVLEKLAGRVGDLMVPNVLTSGEWNGLRYVVVSPLPAVKPLLVPPEESAARLLAVAGTGLAGEAQLDTSAWAVSVRERLEEAEANEPVAAGMLRTWLDQLVAEPRIMGFGRWHGDWIPWNLGAARTGPVAWDWEYSADSVPVGFDLAHWYFQRALVPHDATLEGAVCAAEAAAPGLACLDVAEADRATVVAAYVIEMLTRGTHLAAQGCGWNPKVRLGLAAVVKARTSS